LVVVHGGPTWDHSYLLPQVAALADVAHVIMFDLRGCGGSTRVPPLSPSDLQPEFLADDVAGLISSFGAPADVLGFSFGGRIAMRLVSRHPSLVRRLVLASTTAFTDFDPPSSPSRPPEIEAEVGVGVGVEGEVEHEGEGEIDFDDPALTEDGALSRAMAYAGVPDQIWRLDRRAEWHDVLSRVWFSSDYNEIYASGELRPGAPDDAADILAGWGRRTLILHGERDLVFPVEVARRLHAALPASVLAEIPEAGHMAHFDNPEPWLAAIRGFLTEQTADQRA
jgi:pimeloyl-ACP methyl ester carboxylesterase